jgi:L-ascorbate 6-phosphate lactonase
MMGSGQTGLAGEIEAFEAPAGLNVWWLGGPSVALRTPRSLVYLDLFTGPSPEPDLHRANSDLLLPAEVRRADAVLCTHHDVDHCHLDSLRPIYEQTAAKLVGPASCVRLFRQWGFAPERIVEVAAGKSIEINDLTVTAGPCNDYFDHEAVSYVMQSGGVTAFDGGDTLFYAGYRELGRRFDIDVALLNFAHNPPGEIYYMNHAHVARTAEDLGARCVVPKHYDLWAEFLDDPAPLVPLLAPKGIEVSILRPGERLSVEPRQG